MTQQEKRNRNKAAMIEDHGGWCSYCMEDEMCCLEFHDMFNKKETLSQIWDRSLEFIGKKLKAHEVVCFNCHTKVHAGLIEHAPTKTPNDLAGSEASLSEDNPFKP